jgi:hypothetical protein
VITESYQLLQSGSLSGGEQQMWAVGRGLMVEQDVLRAPWNRPVEGMCWMWGTLPMTGSAQELLDDPRVEGGLSRTLTNTAEWG